MPPNPNIKSDLIIITITTVHPTMSNWYEEPKIPARNFKIGFYSFVGFIGSIYLVKK